MKNLKNYLMLLFVFNTIVYSTEYKKTDLNNLIGNSSLIIEGTVINTESRWLGKKIVTIVTVDISKFYKGRVEGNTIEVTLLGGRVESSEMIVHGNPQFNVQEKVFLLLVRHRGKFQLNSMGMGKFNILKEKDSIYLENKNISAELLTTQSFSSNADKYPKFLHNEVTELIKKTIK